MALFLLAVLATADAAKQFLPHVVSYGELLTGSPQGFHEALTSVGLLAVSNIPGFENLRRDMLKDAHQCLRYLPEDVARGHIFEDGTVRRTIALTTADEVIAHFPNQGDSNACSDFQEKQHRFRQTVGDVAHAFARTIDLSLELDGEPLLHSDIEDQEPYNSLQDVFERGEHLEHVHSYHLPVQHQGSSQKTMDFHTDQGLCIAFTPALLMRGDGALRGSDRSIAGSFHVQLRDGTRTEVDFSDAELVFMLGDGVNQIVNPRINAGSMLRAVPHALSMPFHAENEWRLWYGRMFMAPKDGINVDHQMTFGEIRDLMTKAWVTEDGDQRQQLSLGCSSSHQAHELRELSEAPPCSSGSRRRCSGSCANNQKQCWFRCMNFTQVASDCAGQSMAWNCTNARDEISPKGMHHGNYDLRCTSESNTQMVRGNCDAVFPRLNVDKHSSCTASGFESFLQSSCGTHDHRQNLKLDENNAPEVVFMWSIVNGKVSGTMAFNGKASWLAVGAENLEEDSGKYGMMGARVIFGISSQDTEFPSHTGTVKEYRIHDKVSRFEGWQTPLSPSALENTAMIEENCYTAMSFTTDSIYGESLNITGTNRMIWAARTSTYMQIGKDSYHEGCSGTERTRYRGGGRNSPWIVNFHPVEEAESQAMPENRISMPIIVFLIFVHLSLFSRK
jgi:hypothetical protein